MMKRAIWIALTLSLLGLVSASSARADEWNKKTVLTFSQPVEIPGQVLLAGTYTFCNDLVCAAGSDVPRREKVL